MKAAVAFPRRASGVMDPRRRRFTTIAVVTLILFFVYTYSGHPSTVYSALQTGVDYFLQLPALPAANATLGVLLCPSNTRIMG